MTQESDHLDRATTRRLRRLGSMPVDLTRLDAAVRAEVGRRGHQPGHRLILRLLRPASAVAASVGVLILIAALVLGTSREAMASAAQMAAVHRDILAGRATVHRVDSIDAAGQLLSQMDPAAPDLPQAPQAHVMACCMKSVADKRVACVLLRSDSTPITMSVANTADMRSPHGRAVSRGGATFYVVSHDTLTMLSTERKGRWVCLIGETSPERLMQIAETLKF